MSDEIKNKLNCDYDIISTINHNPVKYLYNSYKLNNTDFKNTTQFYLLKYYLFI